MLIADILSAPVLKFSGKKIKSEFKTFKPENNNAFIRLLFYFFYIKTYNYCSIQYDFILQEVLLVQPHTLNLSRILKTKQRYLIRKKFNQLIQNKFN